MQKRRQSGVTLIELMIAVLIGLIMTAAAITLYVNYLKNTSDNVALIRLNQDMRSVMDIMVRDIRRAGFVTSEPDANFTCLQQNAFADINILESGTSTLVENDDLGTCILYAYNRNDNIPTGQCNVSAFTVAEDRDRFGFRLDTDNATIQMKVPDNSGSMSDCSIDDDWEPITEPDVSYDLDFKMSEKELDMTYMLEEGIQVCPPAPSSVDECIGCESGDQCLTIRDVEIRLEGTLADGTTQEIQERVRIRNDQYENSHP